MNTTTTYLNCDVTCLDAHLALALPFKLSHVEIEVEYETEYTGYENDNHKTISIINKEVIFILTKNGTRFVPNDRQAQVILDLLDNEDDNKDLHKMLWAEQE